MMYLGVFKRGQEGQALIIVLVTILAVLVLLIVGLRVAELAMIRSGVQSAADMAALAGANVQAQGRMMIAVFQSIVFARNLIVAIMEVVAGILYAIAAALAAATFVTLGTSAVAAATISGWADGIWAAKEAWRAATYPVVVFINTVVIPGVMLLYPLYAVANAMLYAGHNGVFAVPLPMKWGWPVRTLADLGIGSEAGDEETGDGDRPPPTDEIIRTCQCAQDSEDTAEGLEQLLEQAGEVQRQIEGEMDKENLVPPQEPNDERCWQVMANLKATAESKMAEWQSKRASGVADDGVTVDDRDCLTTGINDMDTAVGLLLVNSHSCADAQRAIERAVTQGEGGSIPAMAGSLGNSAGEAREACEALNQEVEDNTEENLSDILQQFDDLDRIKKLALYGFDGMAVIVIKQQGPLFKAASWDTRLSDNRSLGLVYAVAYGRCMSMKGIHNKALILQSWEAGSIRAERLRNGFRGFLEVLFDVGKVVGLELVGKFFELVQWFNDKEGSPSGLLPLLPSFEDLDLPGVIKALPGARALYEEFTGIYYKFAQELTTCVLNWFKLENAPDMHEWRPALVRFDVGLTEDSETIANLVEKANRLQETIQSNLDEIIEAAQAADRTIRDVASLFGIPANWPTIPGLDIGEMKAGLF